MVWRADIAGHSFSPRGPRFEVYLSSCLQLMRLDRAWHGAEFWFRAGWCDQRRVANAAIYGLLASPRNVLRLAATLVPSLRRPG